MKENQLRFYLNQAKERYEHWKTLLHKAPDESLKKNARRALIRTYRDICELRKELGEKDARNDT